MRDSLDVALNNAIEILREKRFVFENMKRAGALSDIKLAFLIEESILKKEEVQKR